jgi:hypothetical protein
VQHLGPVGLHPRAFARGKNDGESRIFRHAFALDRLPLSGPGRLIIALTAPEAKRRIVAQNT